MALFEGADRARHDVLRDDARHPDEELAPDVLRESRDLRLSPVVQIANLPCVAEQHVPDLGQDHAVLLTMEQAGAQRFLERLDLEGNGRLREEQDVGGFREAPVARRLVEHSQADVLVQHTPRPTLWTIMWCSEVRSPPDVSGLSRATRCLRGA